MNFRGLIVAVVVLATLGVKSKADKAKGSRPQAMSGGPTVVLDEVFTR